MDDTNKKKVNNDSGSSFVDHQSLVDKAKNERIKAETESEELDPEQANNPARRNVKTNVSTKRTGGGKQSSPGD